MIELNKLPKWSKWPACLLALTEWQVLARTLAKIDQEYECHKWARCLAYHKEKCSVTPEALKHFELRDRGTEEPLCVSRGDSLTAESIDSAVKARQQLIADSMRSVIDRDDTVVELGCGYGYNLWSVKEVIEAKAFVGGDCSSSAIDLASRIFKGVNSSSFQVFNFYDRFYDILENVSEPVVVFTVSAIEQLPECACFFQALKTYRHKIKAVFHFEPMYGLYDDTTLLGLLRKRYTQVNDYNRDLFAELGSRAKSIRVLSISAHALGLNPLNPLSVVHWEYQKE